MTFEETLSARVKALAVTLGFDLAGICEAKPSAGTRAFGDWLARGFAGSMDYLASSQQKREDPSLLFEGARSLVVVGLVYDTSATSEPGRELHPATSNRERVRVSRYAGGDDYHDIMLGRLKNLASGLEALAGCPVRSRVYVDTGPVLERVAASQAGLGWQGKNTCLINRDLGSYLFLGVLVCDLELHSDSISDDLCGTCTRCLDACPSDAFPEPGVLDATRCISYTTIEDPGEIPEPVRAGHGNWVFGCDICQDVCPWNTRRGRERPDDPFGLRARLAPRPEWIRPTLRWLLSLDESSWQQATRGSALRRSKRRGLLRNALVAAGNSGDESLRPLIEKLAEEQDVLLAEHARWALTQLG